ncbi:peptidase T [Aurantibacillus circumpalustris]|uniref:peptidase T n=1 Tax=Aurantibacillus circumpalustris TaxID=3036359 RepID=UPI00295BCCC5|nr:peptidase T [Aurantibacillus circumpalustris]
MSLNKYNFTVTDRFVRYAKIDTQSNAESPTCPSTEKQKNLSRLLVEELKEMGIKDAELDEHGYVYGTIESNTTKKVPVICFCSHVDTAPDCSGTNVKPIIHKNYKGQDLVLPGDTSQVIKVSEHPDLKNQIGNDVITTDGTTLLGSDDKAGVAEIMDAAHFLMTHPEVKHGKVRILFTPDEEIGRGADKANIKKLGADFGYTLDGGPVGTLENETFSADGVSIKIKGFSTHPGYAKDKMQHAIKIAAQIINKIPVEKTPETTEKKQPFIHPTGITGALEEAEIKFIIRAFDTPTLLALEDELRMITVEVLSHYDKSSYEFIVTEQYRNMKDVLDKNPEIIGHALEAITRSGLTPKLDSIRGGTDGSRFSFMGLPCANIFAAQHAIHSKQEWVSSQDMQKAVETIVNLVSIWEEKS